MMEGDRIFATTGAITSQATDFSTPCRPTYPTANPQLLLATLRLLICARQSQRFRYHSHLGCSPREKEEFQSSQLYKTMRSTLAVRSARAGAAGDRVEGRSMM